MRFQNVTVILPTLKETDSLVEAVQMILEMNDKQDIREFLVVVCEKTKRESFDCIEKGRMLAEEKGVEFRVLWQKRPFFGGAIRDAFDEAKGSHVIMVTPDLDTAPDRLPQMIEMSKREPNSIILASRWKKDGGFENYSAIKKIWNFCSQQLLRVIYFSKISDFTWGNHLAPTVVYQSINFQEVKHPINVEKVVIPIRLGIKFCEVGAVCRMPKDDETVNPLLANFALEII